MSRNISTDVEKESAESPVVHLFLLWGSFDCAKKDLSDDPAMKAAQALVGRFGDLRLGLGWWGEGGD